MGKIEADTLSKLNVVTLNRWGYLRRPQIGSVSWTDAYSGFKTKVGIQTSFFNGNYLRVEYEYEDQNTREKEQLDYQIELTTTPCHFGGKRFWFICRIAVSGKPCLRRVGVLYRYGKYFMCRHCCRLTYTSRKLSGRHKGRHRIISIPELDGYKDKVKRTHYRGRPTKKYLRYLEMEERFLASF